MTEQNRTHKAGNFIKKLLQTGVGVYLVLFVVVYGVYFVNGYEQLATHKFELLKSMSGCFALVMIPLAIIYILLSIVCYINTARNTAKLQHQTMPKKSGKFTNFAEWFLREISLTDAAVLDFTCVLVISYLLTSYKEEALWGTAGWYMGLGTQIIMIGIYFFVSRFFDARKIQPFLYFLGIASFLFMLWGLLNRFSIYPIEMEYSQPAFISSMGNINWFCGYYSVVFGVGAVLYFISESKHIRAFAMVHSLVAFALGAVEGSDSAFLSLFTCFFILFLFSFSETQKMKRFLELVCGYAGSCQLLRIMDKCFPEALNMNSFMIELMLRNGTLILLVVAAGLHFLIEVKDTKDGAYKKEWICDYQNIRTGCVILLIVAIAIYVGLLIQNTKYPGSIGKLSNYNIFSFGANWGSNRAITWQDGIMIFKSLNPLQKVFGAGPDCFAIYAYNHPDISIIMESQFGGSRLTNAHNEMITMLVNLGVLGLITFLVVFVSSVVRLVRRISKKPVALVFVVSICSYLIHNQFSFQQILNTPYIYMMLGLAECMMRDMREPKVQSIKSAEGDL